MTAPTTCSTPTGSIGGCANVADYAGPLTIDRFNASSSAAGDLVVHIDLLAATAQEIIGQS